MGSLIALFKLSLVLNLIHYWLFHRDIRKNQKQPTIKRPKTKLIDYSNKKLTTGNYGAYTV